MDMGSIPGLQVWLTIMQIIINHHITNKGMQQDTTSPYNKNSSLSCTERGASVWTWHVGSLDFGTPQLAMTAGCPTLSMLVPLAFGLEAVGLLGPYLCCGLVGWCMGTPALWDPGSVLAEWEVVGWVGGGTRSPSCFTLIPLHLVLRRNTKKQRIQRLI